MARLFHRRQRRLTARAFPEKFKPKVWISGESMYTSCQALEFLEFTKFQEQRYLTLVHVILRDKWDIDARDLTIEWEADNQRYRINFNDEQEFIMVKLLNA